ncbi:MAG: hypothetical protein LBL15_00670 [Oscillospiraceae bacterium]|jgi:V/A-type H+-transporting ATPase subunit I|nr:hypothetical protein [Oscillospiraceae bacterium]
MSVEAMAMVTISGPEKMVETAIKKLVLNRQFHPESAVRILAGAKALSPFDAVNPYADPLASALDLAKMLDIAPDYRDFSGSEYSLKDISAFLEALSAKLAGLRGERETDALLVKNNAILADQLSHFSSFNVELHDLFAMKYLKFHFGRLPAETYRDCMKIIDGRPDVYFVTSGQDDRWYYGAYFALLDTAVKIEAIFSSMGFERMRIDVNGSAESTANELLARLNAERADAETRIGEIDAELAGIRNGQSETLLSYYSWLRFENDAFEMLSCVGRRHGRFHIVGWIPKNGSEDYARECEAYDGFACFLTHPGELCENQPPVKLKKGLLSAIYQPYLEMYGLPAYGEIDPRLFLALTYTFIFGIMFGDVGQGLVLGLAGGLLWKLKKLWLGRIVALCGMSAMVFGFVYGSVFGNERLLPGFKVLEGDNTMKMLIAAIAIGVALISVCMIMNIINGIRQKDVRKAVLSPNGLAGAVMYIGIAAGAAVQLTTGRRVFSSVYIILIAVVPLFLIFASAPLTKLIKGEKDWLPESLVMFFVEGFFELFETLLAYVSNTISFLRVGAYAISHAGMMMVVYLLSSGSGDGYNIIGLIFGNLLVTGLETLLVCIQVLRLEYYELFGRFYAGGGVKFSPKIIDYRVAGSPAAR